MSTDKAAAAIREFAEKQFPLSKELKKEVLYNQVQQAKQNECLSDLTALISEHYVAKEEVDKMVSERLIEFGEMIRDEPNGDIAALAEYFIRTINLKSRK